MGDFAVPDHLGWHEQGDGKLYLGLPIAAARMAQLDLLAARDPDAPLDESVS